MSDKTKDSKNTSSKVNDSRMEKIKEEMGVTQEVEEQSIIDGQVGFEELLQKEVDEEVSATTTPEEVVEIKKEAIPNALGNPGA